ncbi:glycosyltransferase [Microlunatus panaciterrae]|uniref:Trehalose synthase n=1 Tax=Microlunatus panaciterrae TaxID=400768 RepID=A0ABS2RFD0_9ACTN|nr:glycosyltransferase [Microlunatus panaciterrae]MBM7797710.1 trehalose synthase [Microlunatus panaciterrae]
MQHVDVHPISLDRLASLLAPVRALHLAMAAERARIDFSGRVMWHVNATAKGGGVAEMLTTLLAYGRGAGVDTRWLALDGTPEFFTITKRLHNNLHGYPGDGGPLGDAERSIFEEVSAANLAELRRLVGPEDIVLLHDPQPAGLLSGLQDAGAHVVWRCHIGCDTSNEMTQQAWLFLRPYLDVAEGFIFSRKSYCPDWVPMERMRVIPPSIDPFSTKNSDLAPHRVRAVLHRAGLVTADTSPPGDLSFIRRDGTVGLVREHPHLILNGNPPPPLEARLVVQVSRWDRLKDMVGVLRGFAEHLGEMPDDTHLMLVGPAGEGVTDDPEGAEVLSECEAEWWRLPEAARKRCHLVRLPMDDVDENAHLVNAIQRQARVVVQKSLAEGFGLTVTEAMWKARPVIASAVGGICDQITDGQDGLLLDDPQDVDAFAKHLADLLPDDRQCAAMGSAARAHVQDRFIGDLHLIQFGELLSAFSAPDRV